MYRIPTALLPTIAAVVGVVRTQLGNDCTVVVHGSIALGEYVPGRSDLDMLVFADAVRPQALQAMARMLLAWSGVVAPIELSILPRSTQWVHPAPFWFHYSEAWRERLAAQLADNTADWLGVRTDPDLTAHMVVAQASGIVVWGAVDWPQITRQDAFAAVWYDIASAREDVLTQPVYVVLNLCRTIRWLEHGQVLGKTQGGTALLPELVGDTQLVVAAALDSRVHGVPLDVSVAQLQAAVDVLLARVERGRTGL